MIIDVSKCTKCNLRSEANGHGDSRNFCSANHQQIPRKVERARLREGTQVVDEADFPEWCPLPVTVGRGKGA